MTKKDLRNVKQMRPPMFPIIAETFGVPVSVVRRICGRPPGPITVRNYDLIFEMFIQKMEQAGFASVVPPWFVNDEGDDIVPELDPEIELVYCQICAKLIKGKSLGGVKDVCDDCSGARPDVD